MLETVILSIAYFILGVLGLEEFARGWFVIFAPVSKIDPERLERWIFFAFYLMTSVQHLEAILYQ